MDSERIKKLLKQWEQLLESGEKIIKKKLSKISDGGLNGRIRRVSGAPVVFDDKINSRQKEIQEKLLVHLPHLAELITSEPAIMDGYSWKRRDFVDLYFSHFRVVVYKIGQHVSLNNQ